MVVFAGDASLLRLPGRTPGAEVDWLYRRHAAEVLRYARTVLRSGPDAEDATQATFVRALRALERGEQVRAPRNWLIAIAHNECRRVLAGRRRRACEVALGDADAPAQLVESGRAAELRRALEQLAPRQRQALVLRELEGKSYAEIASSLDVTESAVETLIFRARRAVREQLETTLDCGGASALLAVLELSPIERKRLRAHLRGCSACATLERQARGRKGALGRLASGFGLPWGLKTVAVAVTASAVVATAPTLLGLRSHAPSFHAPSPAPPAPIRHSAPVRRQPQAVAAGPSLDRAHHAVRRHARAARSRPSIATPAPAAQHARPARAAPAPAAPAVASPTPTPSPAPVAAPAPIPADPAPAPAAPPAAVPAPEAAPPAVSVDVPAPPAVTVPPVSLPLPVPVQLPPVTITSVALPTVTVPPLPIPVPVPPVTVAIPPVKLP